MVEDIGGVAQTAAAGFAVGGPVGAVIGGAIGVVSSVFGSRSRKKAARRAKREAQRQQVIIDKSAALGTSQNNAQAQSKKSHRAVAALMERGRLRAAIGDTGLEGKGAQQFFLNSLFNEGQDTTAIEVNRVAVNEQIELERQGGAVGTSAAIARAKDESRAAGIEGFLGVGASLFNTAVGLAKFRSDRLLGQYVPKGVSFTPASQSGMRSMLGDWA